MALNINKINKAANAGTHWVFTEYPCELDIEEILTIDYGNFGNTYDRHFWPGIHNETLGTGRPVIIIKTKTHRFVATDAIKFRHCKVKQLPEQ